MTTAAATNYYENLVALEISGQSPTWPTTYALALASAVADAEAGTFTELANSNGYARVAYGATHFPAASTDGVISNDDAIIAFADCTTSDWATVTHVVVVTSTTYGAGDAVAVGLLDTPVTVAVGEHFEFAIGNLTFKVT
jgi:hypothetical protein